MSEQLHTNVRWIEDSYCETWPTATQFGAVHFGPVTEGIHVVLPFPPQVQNLPVDEQWAWLRSLDNVAAAMGMAVEWTMRLAIEREQVHLRVRAVVIERVNAALAAGEIRNAVPRDPQTGKPVAAPVRAQATASSGVPGFGNDFGGQR